MAIVKLGKLGMQNVERMARVEKVLWTRQRAMWRGSAFDVGNFLPDVKRAEVRRSLRDPMYCRQEAFLRFDMFDVICMHCNERSTFPTVAQLARATNRPHHCEWCKNLLWPAGVFDAAAIALSLTGDFVAFHKMLTDPPQEGVST